MVLWSSARSTSFLLSVIIWFFPCSGKFNENAWPWQIISPKRYPLGVFGIVYVFQRSEFSWFSWESRVCEWHFCPKDRCSSQVGIDNGRGREVISLCSKLLLSNDICPWNGRILRTYSVCIYIMSPIWGAHSAAHIRMQYCFVPYKTFLRDKTLCGIHLVLPKTFSRNQIAWRLPALARRVWGGKDRPSVAYQSAWSDRQAYMGSFFSISYVRCLWVPEARPNSWNNTK